MDIARPAVRLDHVALLPASLLVVRDRWQPVLADLPAGEVLVLLPPGDGALRSILELVTLFLATMGHHVTRIETDQLLPAPSTEDDQDRGVRMRDGSGELWDTCQLEREEQTGFFGSTVVYTAVMTGRSGHRQVLARLTVEAPADGGAERAGWTPLAERLTAAGWELVPATGDELPTFRRSRR